MSQPAPLPPRIGWFAPWTWKRRWITSLTVVIALAAYPLSIGPAMLLVDYGAISYGAVEMAYRPACWMYWRCPESTRNAYLSYMDWWSTGKASWLMLDYLPPEQQEEFHGKFRGKRVI